MTVNARPRVRVALVSGPWQLVMLAVALMEHRRLGRDTQPSRTILFLNDPRRIDTLRTALNALAARFSLWNEVIWDDGLLTLKFPDDEWPIDMEKYARPIRQRLGVQCLDELWLCHLHHIEHHCIIETYPEARVIMYEDGLGEAIPLGSRGWRDYLHSVWLAPRLLLSGRLRNHLRSVRLCDWRPSWFHTRRVRHRYIFIARHFPPPPPFRYVPVTFMSKDAMLKALKITADAPIPLYASAPVENIGHRDVLVLGQILWETGEVSWDDEASVYLDAAKKLVAKGYRVWWKEHPRATKPFASYLKAALSNDTLCEIQTWMPAEAFYPAMRFGACISLYSSSLYYFADLFGIPTYTCADALRSRVRPSYCRDTCDLILRTIPSVETIPYAVPE